VAPRLRSNRQDDPNRSVFAQVYDSLGRRLGRRTFEQVRNAREVKPRFTAANGLALLFGLLVHGVTLAFFLFGLYFVVAHKNPGYVILGLILLLVAWELRPRLGKRPKGSLDRSKLPATFELLDRIAASLGARRVEGVVVSPELNASITTRGWRRRTFVFLGLPLVAILTPQEQVAVVAHELGHAVNHDPRRGAFIGTALGSLQTWYYLLRPERVGRARPARAGRGDMGWLATLVVSVVLTPVAWLIRQLWSLMIHLTWQTSQRAEYLADEMASRVAGSAAAASALRKLTLGSLFDDAVLASTTTEQRGKSLIEDFRRRVEEYPRGDLEYGLSKETERGFRLDTTHPPLAYRVEFVMAHPAEADVTLGWDDSERIDAELKGFEQAVRTWLIENYRSSLIRRNR